MDRIVIIGAGDLGQQFAHWIKSDNKFKIVGYVDDYAGLDKMINGIKVVGKISDVINLYNNSFFDKLLIGIGYKHFDFREKLYAEFSGKIPFATFVHSSCFVDSYAKIMEGTVIYPMCYIEQHAVINENVVINAGSVVGHNCVIGPHSYLAGRVLIGGNSIVGKRCMIGNGVVTRNDICIGDDIVAGCGAVKF